MNQVRKASVVGETRLSTSELQDKVIVGQLHFVVGIGNISVTALQVTHHGGEGRVSLKAEVAVQVRRFRGINGGVIPRQFPSEVGVNNS